MSNQTINSLKKKIFGMAVIFCLGMLGFIGFAVYRYGMGLGVQGISRPLDVSPGIQEASIQASLAIYSDSVSDNSVDAKKFPAPEEELLKKGKELHIQKGCVACHSLDGTKMIGPTFKALYGTKVELSDGSFATADEAYLEESIRDPQKKIVKGYEGLPMVTTPMTKDEIEAVIQLLKSIR